MEKSIIETERLILRKPELSDANSLLPLLSDSKVQKFTPGLYCASINNVISYLQIVSKYNYSKDLCFVIESKSSNEIVGIIEGYCTSDNIFPISYACIKSARGNEYIPEALKAFINYIYFSCNFCSASFSIETVNLPSQRVMKKLGIKLVHKNKNYKEYFVSLQEGPPF